MSPLMSKENVCPFCRNIEYIEIIDLEKKHAYYNKMLIHSFYIFLYLKFIFLSFAMCSYGSVVEHCVNGAKVVGSIPREHTY